MFLILFLFGNHHISWLPRVCNPSTCPFLHLQGCEIGTFGLLRRDATGVENSGRGWESADVCVRSNHGFHPRSLTKPIWLLDVQLDGWWLAPSTCCSMVADLMYGSMRNRISFCTSNGYPTPPWKGRKKAGTQLKSTISMPCSKLGTQTPHFANDWSTRKWILGGARCPQRSQDLNGHTLNEFKWHFPNA